METPLAGNRTLSQKTRFFSKLNRWNKIFAHALVFGLQSITFGMPNAIFKTIFVEVGVMTPDQDSEMPKYVGILVCFFFVGKTFSDPLWGYFRDVHGDKKAIVYVTVSLIVSCILFGMSRSFFVLNIAGMLVGLASGIATPGYSFMNWIEEDQRSILSMIINLFNGAGALAGPIIGGYLVSLFPTNKVLYSWMIVSAFITVSLGYFLMSFKDFDDGLLIGKVGTVLDMKELQKIIEAPETAESDNEKRSSISHPTNEFAKGKSDKEPGSTNAYDDDIVGAVDDDEDQQNTVITAKKELGHKREISKMEALKITQCLNSSKVGFEENAEKQKSPFQIFMSEELIRDLINAQSIIWVIKVMDWVLIPIWASLKKEELGLGFTNIEVGKITFYSFPGVLVILVLGYGMLKIPQYDWSIYTISVFGICVLLTPLVGLFNWGTNATLAWLIVFECIKVSCFSIYTSAWGVMMNNYINGTILGRMYSFSFFFSHSSLIVLFIIFPSFLTLMITNSFTKPLGRLNVWIVFIVMALPAYIAVKLSRRSKILILEREGKNHNKDSEIELEQKY